MDEVLKIVREPVAQHWGGFFAILGFSGVFYGVFARMREQVCTTICPYGRLQGVLLVKESIVVAYDHKRGEPRGKLKKNPVEQIRASVQGDCIDCKLCIAVCPTGIDIRNGTQLECTNCTACIDACDQIMEKVDKPKGLIRYDSETGINSGVRRIFTPRVYAYSFVLMALLALDVVLIANRGLVESIILRSPGQLYQEKDAEHITNLYTYKLINKSGKDLPFELKLKQPEGKIEFVGQSHDQLKKDKVAEGAFFVNMPLNQLNGRKTELEIEVISNGKVIDKVTTNFMGPNK
jgi:cytochrome c oxidase accessory protein FixG